MKVTENNQGYSIIERFHIGAQGFVLGENPNAPQPYVTWQCRTDAPNHFFWGHYFSEKEKAYRDYEERIRQEAEHIEQKIKKKSSTPSLYPSKEPSITIQCTGYYPSDRKEPTEQEYNRMAVGLGFHAFQERVAAMLNDSMFSQGDSGAIPKNHDDKGKKLLSKRRDEPER